MDFSVVYIFMKSTNKLINIDIGKKMRVLILFLLIAMTQAVYSQWEVCKTGIYGGDVKTIAIKGSDYIVGTRGGVFISSDNGRNWSVKSEGLYNVVSVIATDGIHIYAGTEGGGMYVSADNGDTWVQNNIGLGNDTINCIVVGENLIFIGTNAGVYASNDNGENWVLKSLGQTNPKVLSLCEHKGVLYAGTNNGIHFAINNGDNWISKADGLKCGIKSIAVNDEMIVVNTDSGLVISKNNWISWQSKSISGTKAAIKTINISGNKIYAGTWGSGMFLSSDMGESWVSRNAGLINKSVSAVAISGNTILAGTQNSLIFRADLTNFDGKPTISLIDNFTIYQDSSKTTYFLIQGDGAGGMIVSKWSDNTDLIPLDSIKISQIGSTRSLTICPIKGKIGTCYITLSVTDGQFVAEQTFKVSVIKPSAIDEYTLSENVELQVSPNPASDDAVFSVSSLATIEPRQELDFNIYNIFGEVVISVKADSRLPERINISGLPNGIYYVRFGNATTKFVKK